MVHGILKPPHYPKLKIWGGGVESPHQNITPHLITETSMRTPIHSYIFINEIYKNLKTIKAFSVHSCSLEQTPACNSGHSQSCTPARTCTPPSPGALACTPGGAPAYSPPGAPASPRGPAQLCTSARARSWSRTGIQSCTPV